MNEDKLKKIQDEIMQGMNKEASQEEMVRNLSREIGGKLALQKKTSAQIEEREFFFAYKDINYQGRQGLMMTVADMFKFKIAQEKYTPYSVTAEIDNNFTMEENLTSVVEAFLRHKLDIVKAGEI